MTLKEEIQQAIELGNDDELDLLCITWLRILSKDHGSNGMVADKLLIIIEDLICE